MSIASPAGAVELAYQWKAGSTYRFEAQIDDAITMTGMGIGAESKFATRSKLAVKVAEVRKDGTAKGVVVVDAFEVATADGRRIAGIDSLPKDALKARVEIDKKGRFTFAETIHVIVDDEGQNMLVSASASSKGNAVTGTGRAGDREVTVYAAFDPKTGKLSGGYSEKTIAAPKKKKVTVKENATEIDVLPTQLLELLRLPDGDVAAGAKATFDVAQPGVDASTSVTVEVEEITAERARLKTTIGSKVDVSDDDGPALDGIGPAGIGGLQLGAAGGAGLRIEGDVGMEFAVREGMLSTLSGTLTAEVQMGGMMSVTTRSKLVMRRIGS
jgi:hypothetical protein